MAQKEVIETCTELEVPSVVFVYSHAFRCRRRRRVNGLHSLLVQTSAVGEVECVAFDQCRGG